jgi:peptide deformylase
MIITDENALRMKCEEVRPDEIDDLRTELESALMASAAHGQPGLGLACPQIGIPKRMAIVRLVSGIQVDLVGCKIEHSYDLRVFEGEGCLSFPGRFENTMRYDEIHVVDNRVEPRRFIATGLLAVVIQHECLPSGAVVHTEDGPKRIGQMVREGYSGRVWCLDKNQKLTLSPIVGRSKVKNSGKKVWVRIKTSTTGPNKQLVCTEDHLCAVIDSVFHPDVRYFPAKSLVGRYIVRKPVDRKRNSEAALYNSEQLSVIAGGLLGDLCIAKSGEVVISHGTSQAEYSEHKAKILNGYTKPGYSGYRKKWSNITVHAPITEQTKLLRKMIYTPEKSAREILPYVDELALAYWYMDDGCLVKNCAQFHTEGFTRDDVVLIKNHLESRFGIVASLYRRMVRSKERHYLHLDTGNSRKLFDIICGYVIKGMEYKLPLSYHNKSKRSINSSRLGFSAKLVTEVVPVLRESFLYDIEVYGHHNFFADNTLVHNCDHLEGVLLPDVAIGTVERMTVPDLPSNVLVNTGKF